MPATDARRRRPRLRGLVRHRKALAGAVAAERNPTLKLLKGAGTKLVEVGRQRFPRVRPGPPSLPKQTASFCAAAHQNFSLAFSSFALACVTASVGTVTTAGTDSAQSSRIFFARSSASAAPVG